MSRGLVIAVWVFCVNIAFTVLNEINPFSTGLDYSLGEELMEIGVETAPGTLSFLGIPEIVNALNVFMDLILGPFRLVPQLMDMIGISGILNTSLTGCVWLVYGWFMFQLITGRTLGDVI
ncbi:MAG: hypothetical protein GX885_11785 [Methanomicrobiales archaeon]|nr:hypothetical protein [Methanomicrobiales archaeon]